MTPAPDHARLLRELQAKLDDVGAQLGAHAPRAARARLLAIQAAIFDRRREVAAPVAYFWLKALIHHPAFGMLITNADSRALRALVDVDVRPVPGAAHPRDFQVVFAFADNHFFEDRALVKTYTHSDRRGRVVGTHHIRWKPAAPRELVASKGSRRDSSSGFFRWIAADTRDAAALGDLVRQEVYPHAIELFFGTYSTLPQHPSYLDPRQR